jgi:hypothetical protein
MATINIANLTFTHKGDYDGSTAYVKNDVVYYATNGNAYIAKQGTTGNVPTNGTYWSQFAAGSGGIWNAGLSLGSAGQVVKVNSGATALEFGTADSGGLVQTAVGYKTDVYSSTATNAWNDVTGIALTLSNVGANSHKAIGNFGFAWGTATEDTVSNFRIRKTIDGGSNWTVLTNHEHGSTSGGAATFRGQTMGLRSLLDDNGGNYTNLPFYDTAIGTTGNVTYQMQQYRQQAGTFYINRTANDSTNYGRGSSNFWVMEVKV